MPEPSAFHADHSCVPPTPPPPPGMNPPPTHAGSDTMPQRLRGVLMLLLTAAFAYWSIVMPLQQAAHHMMRMPGQVAWAICVPPFFILGLCFLILGEKSCEYLGPSFRPTLLRAVIIIISTVLGIVLYVIVEKILAGMSYR